MNTRAEIELRTSRLTLRLPRVSDAEQVALMLNNFAVAGNLSRVPYPYSLGDARAYLKSRVQSPPPGETGFAICLDGVGFIGQCGFHRDHRGNAVLGYYLGQPYWGRGIMTEACVAVIDWFFGQASTDSIVSGVFHFNKASLAIQRKLGFVETGESRLICLARGEEVRHIDTALDRSVWQQRRAAA